MKVSQLGTSTLLILGFVALLVSCLNSGDTRTPLVILGIVLILFYKLEIRISDQHVKFRFGLGLIHRRIPLDQILEAKAVRNALWSGWGIRVNPDYTLYNVSGFDAVELTLKGKKRKVRIGTNVPQELSRYINQKIGV